MNFSEMPELNWEYSYYVFWAACVIIMILVAVTFAKLRLFTV